MTSQPIAANFLAFAARRLQQSDRDITRCCAQLSEQQLWHRGGDYENSIANLLLHLEGNMRQWILHGVAEQPDMRQRDEEFALSPSISGAEAREQLSATIAASCVAIEQVTAERLLEVTDPQPTGMQRHPTVLEAIFQVVGHVQLHTGQIIVLTKQLLARDLDLTMPRKR
jgi:uncharacterized damage-inducible protein DinB